MGKVQGESEGVEAPDALTCVLVAAVVTLDRRLRLAPLRRWAEQRTAPGVSWIDVERAAAAVEALDDAVAALAMLGFGGGETPEEAASAALAWACASSAPYAEFLACLGLDDPTLDDLPAVEVHRDELADALASARSVAGEVEPWRRHAAKRDAWASAGDDRKVIGKALEAIVAAVEERGDAWPAEVRVVGVFLEVATLTGWASGVPVHRSLVEALEHVVDGVPPDATAQRLVNAVLRSLGHRTDAFKAAERMENQRARNGARLRASLAGPRGDAMRTRIRAAVAKHGAVDAHAARELGVKVDDLRHGIASDATLAQELAVHPGAAKS